MRNQLPVQLRVNLPSGRQADALWGDTIIEVLSDVRDVRRVLNRVMEMAQAVVDTQYRAVLVLTNAHISASRLNAEWGALKTIIKPDVFDRLSLISYGARENVELPHTFLTDVREAIGKVIAAEPQTMSPSRKPSTAFYDVLRTLLVHWFRRSGPMTSKALGEFTGFTYPTIAASLKRLAPYLAKHSDRRVELHRFPETPWREFLVLAEGLRETQRFADSSGQPRDIRALVERLQTNEKQDIGIGGVLGARHYMPGIDLAGVPRLDLTMSAKESGRISELLRRLDPALRPAEYQEPARVVIHIIRQPCVLFAYDKSGNRWADEVDCVLDLHEAKLDQQANELLTELKERAKQ